MKKLLLTAFLVIVLIITLASCSDKGDENVTYSPGLKFKAIDSGNGYSVSVGRCTETEIIIPSVYRGKPVTEIGAWAFRGCSNITSITIPDSVTNIGYSAFYNCSSLTSLTIGNGVTSIVEKAFYNTAFYNNSSNWTDGVLYIGKYLIRANNDAISKDYAVKDGTVCIADYAFSGCSNLTSIIIPDSVTSIGDYAFKYCSSLTSITIPDSVTSIGDHAFYECSSLTSIIIPDSVTSIGAYAFKYCSSLTSITIPDSVTNIGYSAFYNCSSLTSITYQGTKSEWKKISKGYDWNYNTGKYTVHCTDGAT